MNTIPETQFKHKGINTFKYAPQQTLREVNKIKRKWTTKLFKINKKLDSFKGVEQYYSEDKAKLKKEKQTCIENLTKIQNRNTMIATLVDPRRSLPKKLQRKLGLLLTL